MSHQYTFFDEITADYFCGGGGWSTGFEIATGRPVDIAVNHDENAIEMHSMNHIATEHYREDVFNINPLEAVRGRTVKWFHASPDCTHFSRARGGVPRSKKIRALAWIILRWASLPLHLRPRIISMENVPEFVTWGPLIPLRHNGRIVKDVIKKDGRTIYVAALKGETVPTDKQYFVPDKKRAGQTFNQFLGHLRKLGYTVEWRTLDASDYGAGTARRRFFLIARCDGKPIVFPQPTHGEGEGLLPKRTAADYIDFSLQGKSIFNRPKPLAIATQRRIARGLDKFTIKNKKPFIVPVGYGERKGQLPRVNDISDPLGTVVSCGKHNLVNPVYVPFVSNFQFNNLGRPIDKPIQTQTSGRKDYLITPHISKYFSGENQKGSSVSAPLGAITAIDHNALVSAVQMPFISSKYGENGVSNVRGREINKPLPTVSATTVHNHIVSPHLIQYHAETSKSEVRAYDLGEPLKTLDTSPRYGIVSANLINYYATGHALDMEKPVPTQTTKDRMAVVTTYLLKYDSSVDLWNWAHVRKLLNDYAGYSIADDEVLIIEINGAQFFIGDIKMRMLTPKELYGCQGFPSDYVYDKGKSGKKLSIAEQVEKVGNSVCPPIAAAIVRANLPEWATKTPPTTMRELKAQMCGG